MIRTSLVLLIAFVASIADTQACSLVPPPIEQMTDDIAKHGVVIKGTLIQAFDAVKERPEIIQADEIYIGQTQPMKFVIYRSKAEFDLIRKSPPSLGYMCLGPGYFLKAGHVFKWLVLMPAKGSDATVNGRWSIKIDFGLFSSSKNMQLLMDKAKLLGRFQSAPPP